MFWLQDVAAKTRLEFFMVIGSFVEEIVGPIPSPFIMTTAAIIAQKQGYPFWELILIVSLGVAVKTIIALLGYFLADKAAILVLDKYGQYLGTSRKEVEGWGEMLTGKWWDDVVLFLLRAIPIFPTLLVTLACGVIKYSKKAFVLTTFFGLYARSMFYIWIGYFGYGNMENIYIFVKDNLMAIGVWSLLVGVALLAIYWFRDRIRKLIGR